MSYNPQNPNGQATSANSSPVVVASDQSAIDTNHAKIAGTIVDTNSGVKSAGTQRVVIATDQPQLTNALKVDGSATTQPVAGNVASGTADSGNPVKVAGKYNATPPTLTDGQRGDLQLDTSGNLKVALNSNAVSATQSGTWTVQPGNTANTTPWNMNLSPATTGGWSVSSQTNLTTTATVSAAAGKFGGYMFINLNSTPAYIQVFDTTGAVTLGTTTPTFVVPIPTNNTAANGAGANLELTNGIAITAGIKVAATTTPTGSTTVTTGLTGFVLYK